jgi:putative phage-type endonuclease
MTALNVRQGTPEWLAARKQGIGASDIPVLTGDSPYQSALELWGIKTGAIEPPEPDADTKDLFEVGHLMEAPLLELYERRTHRHPRRVPRMLVHRDVPWAFASLDAQAPVKRVVEAKWTTATRRWGDEGIPDDVNQQVQWQMFVSGWDVADVVALVGRSPRIVEVARDQPYIDALFTIAARFWYDNVVAGVPPEVDGSESARKALTRLHPQDDGTILPATDDLIELAYDYRSAKAATAAAENEERAIGNAIRAILGDASGIEGLVSYRTGTRTDVNWQAVAGAYRQLVTGHPDEVLDAVTGLHSTTIHPRTLRLLKGDSK